MAGVPSACVTPTTTAPTRIWRQTAWHAPCTRRRICPGRRRFSTVRASLASCRCRFLTGASSASASGGSPSSKRTRTSRRRCLPDASNASMANTSRPSLMRSACRVPTPDQRHQTSGLNPSTSAAVPVASSCSPTRRCPHASRASPPTQRSAMRLTTSMAPTAHAKILARL